MKRNVPLQSRTPLAPGRPLTSRTGLQRSTPALRVPQTAAVPAQGSLRPVRAPLVAKRKPATAEERRARRTVTQRSQGLCERCGAPAENMSHRKPTSQGGEWHPANLLHLCGWGNLSGCHGFCHQEPTEANRLGMVLKSWQDPASEPVHLPSGVWLMDDEGGRRPA